MNADMSKENVRLLSGENVLYETGPVVLTNQRLLARQTAGKNPRAVEAFLRDISSFTRLEGGESDRISLALELLAFGALAVLVTLIPRLPETASLIIFGVGSVAFIFGIYVLLFKSIFRVRPHTIVIFQLPDAEDIPVKFPGRDNPEVEQLTRRFVRAKRGM